MYYRWGFCSFSRLQTGTLDPACIVRFWWSSAVAPPRSRVALLVCQNFSRGDLCPEGARGGGLQFTVTHGANWFPMCAVANSLIKS